MRKEDLVFPQQEPTGCLTKWLALGTNTWSQHWKDSTACIYDIIIWYNIINIKYTCIYIYSTMIKWLKRSKLEFEDKVGNKEVEENKERGEMI